MAGEVVWLMHELWHGWLGYGVGFGLILFGLTLLLVRVALDWAED